MAVGKESHIFSLSNMQKSYLPKLGTVYLIRIFSNTELAADIFFVSQLLENTTNAFGDLLFCWFIRIPCVNFISGLIGAVVIFGYLGYFSKLSGIPINELPISGPDLIFITIPAALSTLPLSELWIVFFLFTLVLIGIDSQLGLVETIVYLAHDLKPRLFNRYLSVDFIRASVCLFLFIIGLFYATRSGFEILCFVNEYCIFLPFLAIAATKVYAFSQLKSTRIRFQTFNWTTVQV